MNNDPAFPRVAIRALACALLCGLSIGCAAMQIDAFSVGWQSAVFLLAAVVFSWKGGYAASLTFGEGIFYAITGVVYLILIALGSSHYAVSPLHVNFIAPFTIVAAIGLYVGTAVALFCEEIYCAFLFVNYGWQMKPRDDPKDKGDKVDKRGK